MVVLKDKTVLITGASSGIGLKTAIAFAKEGCRVAAAGRRKGLMDELLGRLEGGPSRHLALEADISDKMSAARLAVKAIDKFGKIDILVNNAGISYVGLVEEMDVAKADEVITTNLLGTIYVTRAVLPHMIRERSGHIITVSSFLGKRGAHYRSLYAASKFGVEGFMECLRTEVGRHNVKVSMIRPSTVTTEFSRKIKWDSETELPIFDTHTPDQIAAAITRLAKFPRKEIAVGGIAGAFMLVNRLFPAAADLIIALDFSKRIKKTKAGNPV